jgi:ketosteroid isomerase-like protein
MQEIDMSPNADLALRIFDALENRRLEELASYYHPDITFHWPPGLPYSGDHRGADVVKMSEQFSRVWQPLQPDFETRKMDARIAGEHGDEVVIMYTWRGRNAQGETFETDTSSHYRFRDGQLADARMFHYDLPGLIAFVEGSRH